MTAPRPARPRVVSAPAFCDHGRLAEHCEDCQVIEALERGAPLGTPVPHAVPVDGPRAAHDVDLDLGDGRSVFVAAGDLIPPEHVDRPRLRRSDGEIDDDEAEGGQHRRGATA